MAENHKNDHPENDERYKGLQVNSGVEQPSSVNNDAVQRFLRKRKRLLSPDEYVKGILDGNRSILSQAVTLVESSRPEHQVVAQEIIIKCLPYSGHSFRLGITGVPGAGKSTFIEAMGKYITGTGRNLAVLAIDPSSERSKGSILGDKTRMEDLCLDPKAYIRPSPSAGSLGGVARKTRETIILCEAAGFDTIFIETVGVGQSETAVHSMVDFFLLVQIAGAGDELQGIKRGIMEMADAIAINKADGNNIEKATLAQSQLINALQLFPPSESGWEPKVLKCSSLYKEGMDQIWATIQEYKHLTKANGYFDDRRRDQARYWMFETINDTLKNHFYKDNRIKELLPGFEEKVLSAEQSSFVAAQSLLDAYFKNMGKE